MIARKALFISSVLAGLFVLGDSPAQAVTPLNCPAGTTAKGKAGRRQYCVKPNGRRHGPEALWHADGKLANKTIFRNGAKTAYIRFHGNGKPQLKISYRGGKLHGPWEAWYTHGVRSGRGTYKKGILDGRLTLFHFSGARSETGLYKNNQRVGKWVFFHKNGKKAVEGQYKGGQRDGVWVDYDKKGKKVRETTYVGGKPQK